MKEDLKIIENILNSVKIPSTKDSMLRVAKMDHVEKVGELLRTILSEETNTERIILRFQKEYENNFLNSIKRE